MNDLIVRESAVKKLPSKRRKLARQLIELIDKVMNEEDKPYIQRPEDAYRLALNLVPCEKEHFDVFFLNTKNRVIFRENVSVGTLNASIVHPREVFRAAIERNCASIICIHNHPSGDPAPSPEDIHMTRRLKEVGEIVGIELLDHVIVGSRGYFSMKEHGNI